MVLAGCGGGERARTVVARTVTASPSPVAEGRRVLDRSGCLACHQLGAEGNVGPGNSLTGVGDRMSSAALRRALVEPEAPMPSYRQLPSSQLDDLVAYLSSLRGSSPGGLPCPDESDCG